VRRGGGFFVLSRSHLHFERGEHSSPEETFSEKKTLREGGLLTPLRKEEGGGKESCIKGSLKAEREEGGKPFYERDCLRKKGSLTFDGKSM